LDPAGLFQVPDGIQRTFALVWFIHGTDFLFSDK
jgi:hypothetical protein